MFLIFQILNFIIFIGLIVYFVRRPVKEFQIARSKACRRNLEDAAIAKERALKNYELWNQKLAGVAEEAASIEKELVQEAEIEKDQLIKNAMAYASQLDKEITKSIDHERRVVVSNLKRKVIEQAIAIAAKRLKRELTSEDHKRLAKDSLAVLEHL